MVSTLIRKPSSFLCLWVLALATDPLATAQTAARLSDFTSIEEPTVRYFPEGDKFEQDEFQNITDQADGVVRITLRYRSDARDGDRNLPIKMRGETAGDYSPMIQVTRPFSG